MATDGSKTSGVRYYPIDVTRLVKGQVLKIEELENILGMKYPHPRWLLKVLNLQHQIERLRGKMGLSILTMRTHRGTLVVCDDSDASIYNRSMGKRGIRRFVRSSARNIAVDVTKLSDDEAKVHGRTIMRQAMMLAAIRTARHQALPDGNGGGRVAPKMVTGPVQTS